MPVPGHGETRAKGPALGDGNADEIALSVRSRYVQSFGHGRTRGFVHLLINPLGELPQGFDATGGVVLAQQALHRHIDEIGVADVAQAVAPDLFDDFG